ncbi:hypothetical protein AB0L70_29775 [Kribbella sp. NPDC051952]|uniref:hypothetical protein n=1 Tax=Kribbella sp. NPDC051952 TaxID=3154851 RepID=UPI003435496E
MEGPYNRRLQAWRLHISEAVNGLIEREAGLLDNEVFLDAFVNATRAAQATHQQEKLDALRNAMVNSVAPGAPGPDEQARFFRLVDQFSAAHLTLLTFLDASGPGWDLHSLHTTDLVVGKVIGRVIPMFRDRKDWYELLASDLGNARLISQPAFLADVPMELLPLTTPLGERFLGFVRETIPPASSNP